jgi:N-acetylneuraminate synthase
MTRRTARTMIVAEAGVNHNGRLDTARQLVDVAAAAGADAVKFQTFRADRVITERAPKADYQTRTTGNAESQRDMVRRLELDDQAHRALVDYCRGRGIQFLSTPFDLESIDLLAGTLDLPALKLPSGEITNAPFLLKAARSGKRLIMSTGMSTLEEIEAALEVVAFGLIDRSARPGRAGFRDAYASPDGKQALRDSVTLLHCTTAYPTLYSDVNLNAMETMRSTFGIPVGYSDHTLGIAVPVAAVALGAVVIEKHFTLDRALPGPDHQASLVPAELGAMVEAIRQVEAALGSETKAPAEGEFRNLTVVRKSLVAARPIKKGELFTEHNLTAKRPGVGLSPMLYYDWIGRSATRDFEEDDEVS